MKTIVCLAAVSLAAHAHSLEISVKIVDRQIHASAYSYVVPANFTRQTNANANCFGTEVWATCSGGATTTGTATPARFGTFSVSGATFSLQLPDGRIAVVNCNSKVSLTNAVVPRRSCRTPLVDDIRVEFDGDNAKLKWPVSIDGKKLESETYKILGLLPGSNPFVQ